MPIPLHMTVDIELTNRCNASCTFCPREKTPHQGMMDAATFDKALERVVEYFAVLDEVVPHQPVELSFCGMGEPLLHPKLPENVARVTDAGIRCIVASNGSLLDEKKARALLDGGLSSIFINIGEHDEEYESTYHLPFERTLENVVRFNEMSDGRCQVTAVLVNHRGDPEHELRMREYWESHGIDHSFPLDLGNRGGSLYVDHMQYQHVPELEQAWKSINGLAGTPICGVPFHRLFVGYDGNYYLCGNDWEKRGKMGGVFDHSFVDITRAKLAYVATRSPVCRTCNIDPTNVVAMAMHNEAAGTATRDAMVEVVRDQATRVAVAHELVEGLGFGVPKADPPMPMRPLIPVSMSAPTDT